MSSGSRRAGRAGGAARSGGLSRRPSGLPKIVEIVMRTPFTGVGTALITPFTNSGDLDEAAVRRLGRRQIDAGIHFLCPCGTTGENPTLTDAERMRIIEILAEESNGTVPILAGAGGYDTRKLIKLAGEMARRGVS